jgi:hypothetical protein
MESIHPQFCVFADSIDPPIRPSAMLVTVSAGFFDPSPYVPCSYHLAAVSSDERQAWLDSISAAISSYDGPGAFGSAASFGAAFAEPAPDVAPLHAAATPRSVHLPLARPLLPLSRADGPTQRHPPLVRL